MSPVSSQNQAAHCYNEAQLSSKAGVFSLKQLSLLKISGEDAEKFLQGQLTCDMAEVTNNTSRFAASCTPKGRMISLFRILKVAADYWLIMNTDIVAAFKQHLAKYMVFYQVEITDISTLYTMLGLSHSLAELVGSTPVLTEDKAIEIDEHLTLPFAQSALEIIGFSPQRWLIIFPSSENEHFNALFANRDVISTQADWNYLNIVQKIPYLNASGVEKFLPHEVGLPEIGGVSFKKGCYTGQEIIARMEFRGTLTKHTKILEFPQQTNALNTVSLTPSAVLKAVENDKLLTVGNLINKQLNSASQMLLLASVKDSWAEKGKFTLNAEIPSILRVRN